MDMETQIGALISKEHLQSPEAIELAKQSGATLLTGGYQVTDNGLANGNFVIPTVFTDCHDDMPHVQQEIFGPVMSVLKFTDEDDVIRRANDTKYGLAAGVFTQNLSRAHRVIHQMQAGICWVNTWGDSPAEMPVGGYKLSGLAAKTGQRLYSTIRRLRAFLLNLATTPALMPNA